MASSADLSNLNSKIKMCEPVSTSASNLPFALLTSD